MIRNIRTTNIRSFAFSFGELVCALLLFTAFCQDIENAYLIRILKVTLAGILWLCCFSAIKFNKKQLLFIFIFILYAIFETIFGYANYQVFAIYLPVALFLNQKERLNKVLWTVLAIVIVLIVSVAWFRSPDYYTVFTNYGRNYVSVFSIFALAIFNLTCEKYHKDCPMFAVMIIWILSISAVGRGGIIATSFIMALFFIKYITTNNQQDNKMLALKVVLVGIIILVLIILILTQMDFIQQHILTRFFSNESSIQSSNTLRLGMITSYLDYCFHSPRAFLFGADASMFATVANNLHNSYLQVHSEFGILGVGFLIVGIIQTSGHLYKAKKINSLFIFWGILVRSMTDLCFPGFIVDSIVLYYILMPYFESCKNNDIKDEWTHENQPYSIQAR